MKLLKHNNAKPGGISRSALAMAMAAVLGGSLLNSPVASAESNPSDGMTENNGCMDDLFTTGTLNCTANDVRIASADETTLHIDTTLPGEEEGPGNYGPCAYPGDMVTFTAQFNLALSATERYDIGMYFATDGDPNADGALTGSCSISTLAETGTAFPSTTLFTDLDTALGDSGDLCGDMQRTGKTTNPSISQPITIDAVCKDEDGNGFLDLPNCTSWRQPGSNETCDSPLDAFPGSPSKCNCDENFQVPVPVPPPTISVVKTAGESALNQTADGLAYSVPETSAAVVYKVVITNDALAGDDLNTVILQTLVDVPFGNLFSMSNPLVSGNTCPSLLNTEILPGASVSCVFTATVTGNQATSHVDTVTASGRNKRTPPSDVQDSDDATVTFTDVKPDIYVLKTANPTTVPETGADVVYTYQVFNNSIEAVTIDSLTDDIYGTLAGDSDCQVGTVLAPGASCEFPLTKLVSGHESTVTNTFTAEASDDDGNSDTAQDTADVNITNVPPSVEIVKSANPTHVPEPGANVTFTVLITNYSAEDVTITSLVDDVYGDLNGEGTCVTGGVILANGGTYSCNFTGPVSGNAGDVKKDTVTVIVEDDEGTTDTDESTATVDIDNVPPAATLTKTVTSMNVNYQVVVANDSTAEDLTLTQLVDDKFGDITSPHAADECGVPGMAVCGQVVSSTCSVSQILSKKGDPTDTYTCSFVGVVTETPHTNTATGTVTDDDGGSITRFDSATVSHVD